MSNTECDRVKCVHNKMCNYLFELFDAQFTKVIDCNSYEEKRPQGEWIVGEYMDCHSDILPEYTCPFCGEVAYRKYDFCHCGADMRGGRK